MILVDTSVWIEYFRKNGRVNLKPLEENDEIVTCPPVVQEVLQGFRDEGAFRIARDAMLALPVLESPLGEDVFVEAAEMFRLARRRGLTVRSSADCLIAACAVRNGAILLHVDRDYDALSQISLLQVMRLG